MIQSIGEAIDFGFSRELFRQIYAGKAVYLFRRAFDPNLVSWADVDEALLAAEAGGSSLRLFRDGEVPRAGFMESLGLGGARQRIVRAAFCEHIEKGATLVFDGIEAHSAVFASIAGRVAAFAGGRAMAQGMISLLDTEAFAEQREPHDLFSLQLIGCKLWQVYRPDLQYPLAFDAMLEAGDVLYVPRGWWHMSAPARRESFHLNVSVRGEVRGETWSEMHGGMRGGEVRHVDPRRQAGTPSFRPAGAPCPD